MKLAYETICKAVTGDKEAMGEILEVYHPYIKTLATLRQPEINGVGRPRLDHDAAQTIRKKLMEEIPKWKEICK